VIGDVPFNVFARAISAARVNVNVTRRSHATVYASATSRPFELAASGAAIVSNPVNGMEQWFEPGRELLVASTAEEAVDAYRQALAYRPGYLDALKHLGNALRALGRLDEAMACYDAGLRLVPVADNTYDEGKDYAKGERRGAIGEKAVQLALKYLGIPYVWGGATPEGGFDCSGLVMYVFGKIGVSLPHNAAAQYGYGMPVSRDQLQAGDLVFFNGLGHVGIYIGGGQFIHAPHTGDVVKISSLSDSWYSSTFVGARRL
jgi:tetratricopeptide (TPR) repeat protein